MFQLIILTLLLNLPITPMPSESVVIGGVRGNKRFASLGDRPIVAPGKVNWWQDSARPGEGSNVVLYGHSTDVFSTLNNIQPGATITINWQGQNFAYVVRWVFVVDEDKDQREAGRWIDPTDREQLTLVTCAGDDRLIVIAEALQ